MMNLATKLRMAIVSKVFTPPSNTGLIAYHLLQSNSNDSFSTYNGTDTSITYNGQSASFNGSTSKILFGAGLTAFKVSTYSDRIWVKFNAVNVSQYIINNNIKAAASGSTSNSGCALRLSADGKLQVFYMFLNNESTIDSNGNSLNTYFAQCTSNTTISTGVWYNVGMSINSNNAKLYINGSLDCSVSSSQSIRYSTVDDNYSLGILKRDASQYYPLNGYLSLHRPYNRVLTDAEFLNDYNYEKSGFGL